MSSTMINVQEKAPQKNIDYEKHRKAPHRTLVMRITEKRTT